VTAVLPAPPAERPTVTIPTRRPRRAPGTRALLAMFMGYPLWWCLGLGAFSWVLFSLPLAWVLWRSEKIRVPRGFGVWMLFLATVLLSATQLNGAGESIGFAWRLATYLSATVVFLFAYNSSPADLPGRRVATALGALWVAVALGGWLGILAPSGSLPSLTGQFLPASVAADPFVMELTRPSFAQVQDFLGYDLGRPKAPFAYTNDWGSNFGLLFPVFVLGWWGSRNRLRHRLAPLLLLLSLVPALYSLNRGMWLSLGVGLVYVAFGFASRGRSAGVKLLVTVATVLGAALLVVSPLRAVVEDRLDTPHSNEGRELLYGQALDLVGENPLIGHGAPQDVGGGKLLPDVGTQGQLWLVLVSQGAVGAALFVIALAGAAWRTRRGPTVPFWCHVVLVVGLVQLPFYDMLPVSLHVIALCAAIAMRRVDEPVAA
jgi:polysaccharide biosynthesis protein PslJ